MYRGITFVLWSTLLALIVAGCIATPRTRAVVQDSGAGYRLGLTVDEELRVVAIDAESAATTAGVEIGDQLVDLTWILSEAPEEITGAEGGSATAALSATTTTAAAPLRPPPGVEHTTVPFSAADEIRTTISYGLPLRLHIMRDGEIHALTIVPTPPDGAVDAPAVPERYF